MHAPIPPRTYPKPGSLHPSPCPLYPVEPMGVNNARGKEWEQLSKSQENFSFTIGEIPVTCEDMRITTLYVGSHAVKSYVRTDRYAVCQVAKGNKYYHSGAGDKELWARPKQMLTDMERNSMQPKRPLTKPSSELNSTVHSRPNYLPQQPQKTITLNKPQTISWAISHIPPSQNHPQAQKN